MTGSTASHWQRMVYKDVINRDNDLADYVPLYVKSAGVDAVSETSESAC